MREVSQYAGKEVKIKDGVGISSFGDDLSGQMFIIEDWCENVMGCSWMYANGNLAAMEYAMRTGVNGKNNDVPTFCNDVLYGKVGPFGHLFHVNELNLTEVRKWQQKQK